MDLVLSSNDSMVLVEVKIAAAETETKYMARDWYHRSKSILISRWVRSLI